LFPRAGKENTPRQSRADARTADLSAFDKDDSAPFGVPILAGLVLVIRQPRATASLDDHGSEARDDLVALDVGRVAFRR